MKQSSPCPLCGGKKTEGFSTFTVDLKTGVLVIREVPAEVCDQCGESWIADKTAEKLEKITNEFKQKMAQVEVVVFSKVA